MSISLCVRKLKTVHFVFVLNGKHSSVNEIIAFLFDSNNKPENKDSEEDEQDSLLPTNSKEDGSYK